MRIAVCVCGCVTQATQKRVADVLHCRINKNDRSFYTCMQITKSACIRNLESSCIDLFHEDGNAEELALCMSRCQFQSLLSVKCLDQNRIKTNYYQDQQAQVSCTHYWASNAESMQDCLDASAASDSMPTQINYGACMQILWAKYSYGAQERSVVRMWGLLLCDAPA